MGVLERRAEADARRPGGRTPNAGPPPAVAAAMAAATAKARWDQPVPLDLADGACEPFPLAVLPEWLADLSIRIGRAVPCPPDYPATFALAIAAGTVGGTLALGIKGQWTERPVLYACVVARPNDGKSPALDPLMEPVNDDHAERIRLGTADTRPGFVADVTVESLATLLADNPRGLLLVRDELAGWVTSMDQYKAKGGGSDRQFWLSNWSTSPVNVRRKNPERPALYVRRPCVSVVGGLQPAILDRLRGADDGFFDRILFSFPAPLPASGENWDAVTDEDLADWRFVLQRLRDREMYQAQAESPRAWLVRMDDGARAEWEAVRGWIASRLNDESLPEPLRGPVGKLSNYAARLALVLYALRTSTASYSELPPLSAADMAGGAALVRYFHAHGLKAFRAMNRDSRVSLARKVLGWVTRNRVESFSRRDCYRALWGSVEKPEDLGPPLDLLEQTHHVRPDPREYKGVGRKPSDAWEVNPEVLSNPSVVSPGGGADTEEPAA